MVPLTKCPVFGSQCTNHKTKTYMGVFAILLNWWQAHPERDVSSLFIYLFIYLCANQRKHEVTDDKRIGKINAILSGHMFYMKYDKA